VHLFLRHVNAVLYVQAMDEKIRLSAYNLACGSALASLFKTTFPSAAPSPKKMTSTVKSSLG
jgi:hypothetical protein